MKILLKVVPCVLFCMFVFVTLISYSTVTNAFALKCKFKDYFACETAELPELDGQWKFSEVNMTGINTESHWNEANSLMGKEISIDGRTIYLPNGTKCGMVTAHQVYLRDDRNFFGSAPASFKKLGLKKTSEKEYRTLFIELDCPRPFRGFVLQQEISSYFLRVRNMNLVEMKQM